MLHDMITNDTIKKSYETNNLKELHEKKNTYNLVGKFDNSLINPQGTGINNIITNQQYDNTYIKEQDETYNENNQKNIPEIDTNNMVNMYRN
jgi:hypothetical protein